MNNEETITYLVNNGAIQSVEDTLKIEELKNPKKIPPLIKILKEDDFLKRNHGFDIVVYTGGFEYLGDLAGNLSGYLEQKEGATYPIRLNIYRKYSISKCSAWYPNPFDGKIKINLENIENERPLYKTNREFIEKINEILKKNHAYKLK